MLAEGYITRTAAKWKGNPKGVYLQDVNYALLGLVSAGVGKSEEFVREVHKLGIKPTMFGIEHAYNWLESMPDVAKSAELKMPKRTSLPSMLPSTGATPSLW